MTIYASLIERLSTLDTRDYPSEHALWAFVHSVRELSGNCLFIGSLNYTMTDAAAVAALREIINTEIVDKADPMFREVDEVFEQADRLIIERFRTEIEPAQKALEERVAAALAQAQAPRQSATMDDEVRAWGREPVKPFKVHIEGAAAASAVVAAIRGGIVALNGRIRHDAELRFTLSDESAVAMVEELMKPKPVWPAIVREDEIAEVASRFGFAGGNLAEWLRAKLEDWKAHREHNVELTAEAYMRDSVTPHERLDILTKIWDAARAHGWDASLGTSLAGFVEGKLNELQSAVEHAKASQFVSRESFNATERGRVDAIGELRIVREQLVDERNTSAQLRAQVDEATRRADQWKLNYDAENEARKRAEDKRNQLSARVETLIEDKALAKQLDALHPAAEVLEEIGKVAQAHGYEPGFSLPTWIESKLKQGERENVYSKHYHETLRVIMHTAQSGANWQR